MVTIFETELIDRVRDYDVVLVGMGINNAFSQGFANDIAVNFPNVRNEEISKSPYGDRRKWGTVLPIEEGGTIFCMCYMHTGGYRDKDYVKYDALKKCLEAVAKKYAGKRIASPLLGASKYDGNGDREMLMEMYRNSFKETDIDLYLYEQKTLGDEVYRKLSELVKKYHRREITKEEMAKERNRLYWVRENGIFKQMPENYQHRTDFNWDEVLVVGKKDLEK